MNDADVFNEMPIERRLHFIRVRREIAMDAENPESISDMMAYVETWGPWMNRALYIAIHALKQMGTHTSHVALKQIKELKA